MVDQDQLSFTPEQKRLRIWIRAFSSLDLRPLSELVGEVKEPCAAYGAPECLGDCRTCSVDLPGTPPVRVSF
jgi:hypothetical protein